MILLVDYSTIAYRCWHSQKGKPHIKKQDTERATFETNLARSAYFIRARFPEADILVCVDSPTWRVNYWKNCYTKTVMGSATTVGKYTFAKKDGFWYMITELSDTDFSDWRKLDATGKKQYLEPAIDHFLWTPGEPDKRTLPKIKELIGSYKGSHLDSDWPYSTPKNIFKQWSNELSTRFADTLGGYTLKVQDCEADDLISYGVRNCPPGETVMVMSTDQDITRSESKGYGQLMDMCSTVASWDEEIYKPQSHDVVLKNAMKKVLLGDPGDDIGPCLLKNGNRVTPTIAENLLAHGETYDLKEDLDCETFDRNLRLIWLRDESPFEPEMKEEFSMPKDYPFNPLELDTMSRMEAMKEGRTMGKTK